MAVENLTATGRGDKAITETVTTLPGMNMFESTVEMTAAASATSTYKMARIPTNVRISNLSKIQIDDLASTGSPTLDFGLMAIGSNITTSTTTLNDGIDAATASNSLALVKDPAKGGKYAWEIAGASSDPGGSVWVYFTILDADCNTGGTVTLSLVYHVDNS